MRRTIFAALVFSGTALAACSDDTTPVDTGPTPEKEQGVADAGVDRGPGPGPEGGVGDARTEGAGLDVGVTPDKPPSFYCSGVNPPAGNNGAAVTLTLDGYLFDTNATVALLDSSSGAATALGAATVSDTNGDGVKDQAVVTVPAGTPQGLYEVQVTNPSTGQKATCGTYISTTELPPTLTDVAPDTAWQGNPADAVLSDQPISLKGTGFKPVPTVRFISVATKQVYQAPTTGFISATALTSICPSESLVMPVGDYYVEVMNPSLLTARWMKGTTPGIFKVTAVPPPVIDDVSPYKVAANAGGGVPAVTVTVTGDYFQNGLKLLLLLADGTTKDITAQVTKVTVDPTGKDSVVFTWNNTVLAMPVGVYPLRLINPDQQYDTYFSMLVENAEPGKLNADKWATVANLTVPRERHASVEGFDVFGGSFLYTVGGTTPASGGLTVRPRTVLASTEFLEVDLFGTPGSSARVAEQLAPGLNLSTFDAKHGVLRAANLMQSPRTGLTLVRAGRFLFAIGGAAADTWEAAKAGAIQALNTVERARILGYENMPNLSLPVVSPATVGLPKGSWYYQVSAVTPEGESLPSREVAALQGGGLITLKWAAVPGATSYLIYRSLGADGRAGSTRLIKAGVTATTFADDGQGELTPAPGFLSGKVLAGGGLAVGSWTYRVTAKVPNATETLASYPVTATTSAGNQTVELSWHPLPNATYSVYRTEGTAGGLTYLLASGVTTTKYSDDGSKIVDKGKPAPDGTPPLPTGSLSTWSTLPQQLVEAREGADAVVVKAVDGNPATTGEPSYIFVVGGRKNNAVNADNLRTTERAQVDPETGALGAFQVMTAAGGGPLQLTSPRAFFALLKTQGRNEIPSPPPPPPPPCPDNDGDGFTACSCGGKDCNDADPTVYPGAKEICGDGKDQDCDQGCGGGTDLGCGSCQVPDADGDGYNRPACGGSDCNDADPTICPDKAKCPEKCGDGIDQDCDGKDLPCACVNPDKDGDGFNSKECGGNDCNDNDPKICPDKVKCPDLTCDGIDQDCSGTDVICSKPPPGGMQLIALELRGPRMCKAPLPSFMPIAVIEEPVYLVAVFGDASYTSPGQNEGLKTVEVALVRKDGTLGAWTLQNAQITAGTSRYGIDGLLYHNFVFAFQGVMRETLGQDPPANEVWNNVFSFTIDTAAFGDWTEPVPPTFLYDFKPADAYMQVGRAYLSIIRLNAYIFGIAGNVGLNGTAPEGPVGTIERIKQ